MITNHGWLPDVHSLHLACLGGRSMDATRSLFLRESGELMFRCLPMALNEITRLVQVYYTWSLEHIYPLKQTGSGCCMNWCYSVKLVGDCCCIVGLAVRIIVSDELITRSQCPYPRLWPERPGLEKQPKRPGYESSLNTLIKNKHILILYLRKRVFKTMKNMQKWILC